MRVSSVCWGELRTKARSRKEDVEEVERKSEQFGFKGKLDAGTCAKNREAW